MIVSARQETRVPDDALSAIFVDTRQTVRTFEGVEELLRNPRTQNHARAMSILGPARCGKTQIVREYVARRDDEAKRGVRAAPEVAMVEVPGGATLKTIATETLSALGDPDPDYGNQAARTERAARAIRDGGYDLIVFDEVHMLVDSETKKVLHNAAMWFTQMLNKGLCPLLLVGEESFRRVLANNAFLAGRSLPLPPIRPFDWRDRDDFAEFRYVLSQVEEGLGLPGRSGLVDAEVASRICEACGGRFGVVELLLTHAREIARRRRHSCLTRDVLRDAVEDLRHLDLPFPFNPFDVEGDLGQASDEAAARARAGAIPREAKRGPGVSGVVA